MENLREKTKKDETYFPLEEACTILTHNEVEDVWSSQVPDKGRERKKELIIA